MAANPTIQLKRKTTSGAPASLSIGEPAVNTADNQLYIGVNSSGIKWIGAEIENSATNGTTWSSDLKLATKKAIGDYFAAKSGTTFTGDITLSGGSDIRFVETGGGTDYVAIQAPASVSTGNVTLTLPGSYAAADGYVLSSTTGGTLSWISAGTATSVSVTETSANSAFNLLFTSATSTTSASIFIDTDDKITFNPSTNTLAVTGTLNVDGLSIAQTTTSDYQIINNNDDNTITITQAATSDAASIVLDTTTGSGLVTITALSTVATGDLAVNGGDVTTTVTGTATLFNTTATTVNIGGAATAMTLGDATSSTITLRGGTLVGNTATQNVFDTTATTVNAFGAATTCTIGHDGTSNSTTNIATGTTAALGAKTVNIATNGNASATVNVNIGTTGTGTCQINSPSTDIQGDLTVRGGDIISNQTSFNLLNSTVTSLSIGGASTSISIGAATGTTTINNANTVVTGDLAVNGADITTTTTGTATLFNSNATTVNIGGAATTMTLGASTATINLGSGTTGATVVIKGNLQVDGSTTTINSTTLTVDDKLIELAHSPSGAVGNDAAVDGGGIQLNSSQGNKTFTWVDSTDAWTSSEHLNLASGKAYYINGASVLNATTLGSTVTGSSLTQVGTVTLGTWNGTTIGVGYGGTGLTTYTTGQILYASAASTLAGLTASSTAGAVVSSTGAGTAPEYKTISVTNGTVTPGSGTLTLAIQDASADGSTKGLATFNATQFDSASGVITLDTIDGGTYA